MRNLSARERPTPAACGARGDPCPRGSDIGARTPSLPSDHPDLTGQLDPFDLNLPQGCSSRGMKSACSGPPAQPCLMPRCHPDFAKVLPTPWLPSLGNGVFSQLCQPPPGLLSLGDEGGTLQRDGAGGGEHLRCHGQRSSLLIWGWVMPRIHYPRCNFYLPQPTL